jgi:Protein of unknown function (DUF1778)
MNVFYKRLLFGVPKSKYVWSNYMPIFTTGAINGNGRVYVENISLDPEDYAQLIRHLENPPKPNEYLKALFREFEGK